MDFNESVSAVKLWPMPGARVLFAFIHSAESNNLTKRLKVTGVRLIYNYQVVGKHTAIRFNSLQLQTAHPFASERRAIQPGNREIAA